MNLIVVLSPLTHTKNFAYLSLRKSFKLLMWGRAAGLLRISGLMPMAICPRDKPSPDSPDVFGWKIRRGPLLNRMNRASKGVIGQLSCLGDQALIGIHHESPDISCPCPARCYSDNSFRYTGSYLEGQRELVSRCASPVSHILVPAMPIVNLLAKAA